MQQRKKFWFMQMYICISQRNKWVCPKSDFLKNCDFGWFFLHHKIAAEVRSYLIQYVYCVPVHNYSIFNLLNVIIYPESPKGVVSVCYICI